jgi:hypothetical protein
MEANGAAPDLGPKKKKQQAEQIFSVVFAKGTIESFNPISPKT